LDLAPEQIRRFVRNATCAAFTLSGLEKRPLAFTSNYEHWHYHQQLTALSRTMKIMQQLLDLRTPPSLTPSDCYDIGRILTLSAGIACSAALEQSPITT
jgi:hypothetical protein